MGAQHVHLECVVDLLVWAGLGVYSNPLLAGAPRALRAGQVDEGAPGGCNQPGLEIARGVVGPGGQCLDQGLLNGVLGRREVGTTTDEHAPRVPVAKTRARSVAENEALLLEGAAVVFGVLVGVLDLPEAIVRGGSIGMAMASAMGARAEAKRMALATTTSTPSPAPAV